MPPGSSQSALNWVSHSSTRPWSSRISTCAMSHARQGRVHPPEKPVGPPTRSSASRAKMATSPYEPSGSLMASRRSPSQRNPARSTAATGPIAGRQRHLQPAEAPFAQRVLGDGRWPRSGRPRPVLRCPPRCPSGLWHCRRPRRPPERRARSPLKSDRQTCRAPPGAVERYAELRGAPAE